MSDRNYATASNKHVNRFKMAHMIGVAEYMRERAPDYMLDPDAMYVVGLLHDIGYLDGREGHEQRGARTLEDLDMDEGVVSAIENHGKNLYELRDEDSKAITPLLVLLIEADTSVDARGYRVGFEGRLADIGRRYGEDHIAYKTVKDNIRFIKKYQKERGIASGMMREPQQSEQQDGACCSCPQRATRCRPSEDNRRQDAVRQRRQGKPTALYQGRRDVVEGKRSHAKKGEERGV